MRNIHHCWACWTKWRDRWHGKKCKDADMFGSQKPCSVPTLVCSSERSSFLSIWCKTSDPWFSIAQGKSQKANEHLIDCAVCITSQDDILKEKCCRNDVSRSQLKILTDEEALELSNESAADASDSMRMSFAFIANRAFFAETLLQRRVGLLKSKTQKKKLSRE